MGTLALYELSETYRRALEAFSDPDADLQAEAIADTLEGLEGALQDKAKFISNSHFESLSRRCRASGRSG